MSNKLRIVEKFLGSGDENVATAVGPSTELAAPVDLERLREILGDNRDEILEILNLYRTEMTENLTKMDEAIASSNAGEITKIAHNSLGTNANCGMVAVVKQLRELERMGRENQLTGAASLNAQVWMEFARIKLFLDENFELLVAAS